MAVPDYQTLMRPLLRLVVETERPVRECVDLAADEFSLSSEEREERLRSGQTVLYNRVHWAITYMGQAGLLERPRRGVIAATPRGRDVLQKYPDYLDNNVLMQFPEFRAFRQRSRDGARRDEAVVAVVPQTEVVDAGTPEERIELAFQEMNSSLRQELLVRIVIADPSFFERLILHLMTAMGYGGSGSIHHLGKTSDGGVDGLINEDPLGLDAVYLQAKRYAPGNGIGVDKVREFAGSLDERGAIKGVFVTTSHFAPQARQYADRSPKRLILIDGEELSRLLVRYGVGVRTFQTIELKRSISTISH